MRWIAWLCLSVCAGCAAEHDHLTHWQLTTRASRAPIPVTLPSHFDDQVPHDSTYVLTTRHRLTKDKRGRDLDFVIPHFWAITRLTVDGQPSVRVRGPLAAAYRQTGPHVFRIPAASTLDGALELELAVDHRWTQSSWFDVVPRIVFAEERDPSATVDELFNVTLGLYAFATLMQIGLACLAVYFIGGRRRRMYLWFGIQAVTAAPYPLFTHGAMPAAFGYFDVPITATGLVIAIWASLRFSHEFFELGPVPRRWDMAMLSAGTVCALAISPYLSTQLGGRTAIGVVALGVVVQSRLCIRQTLIPEKRRDARWYLACWAALTLTTWNEMVSWGGFGEVFSGARIACVGLTFFALFLSILLSERHMGTLEQGDRLNAELACRVQDLERRGSEVEQLNTELRRQIAQRSEQIYAALALRDRRGAAPAPIQAGDVLNGRYRVETLLGTGGMGSVYEVTRLVDGVHFALKLTRETHGEALALLAREAQIAAQLSHPNVVQVVDVDIASSGFLFVVMELVSGRPLMDQQARYGDVPWALSVLVQVARGLSVLHQAGIVHRDVKPPNILIGSANEAGEEQVKITDFGISRFEPDEQRVRTSAPPPVDSTWRSIRSTATDTAEPDTVLLSAPREAATEAAPPVQAQQGLLTRGGFLAGTPSYMAPELARKGARATPAADLFSLGVVAWELFCSRRPCHRPAAMAVMQGDEPDPIPSLREGLPEADPELVRLIDACLLLEPTLRPSAAELAEGLSKVAERMVTQGGLAMISLRSRS